jgi:hypothetical protein
VGILQGEGLNGANDFGGILFSGGGRIFNDINVFAILFHEVVLPGVFFQGRGVMLQIIQLFTGFADLFNIVFLLGFQLLKLSSPLTLLEIIPAVKKQHPHHEKNACYQVFIRKYTGYFFHQVNVGRLFWRTMGKKLTGVKNGYELLAASH